MPELLPPVAAPIVSPLRVIPEPARAVLAAMEPADIVITICVDEGVETDNVVPAKDAVTLDEAKNEVGYTKVMVAPVPPAERPPPAEGVNLRYAVQPVLPASRSLGFIEKLTPVTLSPMLPALKAVDGKVSKEV